MDTVLHRSPCLLQTLLQAKTRHSGWSRDVCRISLRCKTHFCSLFWAEGDIDILLDKFHQENQGHVSSSFTASSTKKTAALDASGVPVCTSEWRGGAQTCTVSGRGRGCSGHPSDRGSGCCIENAGSTVRGCVQARTERRRAGGQTQVCLPPNGKTCRDGSGVCSICPEVVRL